MNDNLLQHDQATLAHINEVRENIWLLIKELDNRAQIHDASKFDNPEREIFAANTAKLAVTSYGTPEYEALLESIKPAIENHYSKNRHHPEHFSNGIEGMDLIDLVEMLANWCAATARNKNGNIHKSIDFNETRFGICPQLAQIFRNTVNRYF